MIRSTVIVALGIALAGCGVTSEPTPPPPTTTYRPPVVTTPVPIVTTDTAPVTAVPVTVPGCDPAPADAVATISAAFTDPADTLADAFAVTTPGGVVYVGANIMQGTMKVSSADVWLVDGPAVLALSSDARRRTTLPDGGTTPAPGMTTAPRFRGASPPPNAPGTAPGVDDPSTPRRYSRLVSILGGSRRFGVGVGMGRSREVHVYNDFHVHGDPASCSRASGLSALCRYQWRSSPSRKPFGLVTRRPSAIGFTLAS